MRAAETTLGTGLQAYTLGQVVAKGMAIIALTIRIVTKDLQAARVLMLLGVILIGSVKRSLAS